MNRLVWKLLRRHISGAQLAGFFLASLFGMSIVLLGIQFYRDVAPVFTQGNSFLKKDYLIATRKISTLGNLTGRSNTFSPAAIDDLRSQPFTRSVGAFTPSLFDVSAGLGMQEAGIRLSTEMFFESVPDAYILHRRQPRPLALRPAEPHHPHHHPPQLPQPLQLRFRAEPQPAQAVQLRLRPKP